jgi:hypothetical protein
MGPCGPRTRPPLLVVRNSGSARRDDLTSGHRDKADGPKVEAAGIEPGNVSAPLPTNRRDVETAGRRFEIARQAPGVRRMRSPPEHRGLGPLRGGEHLTDYFVHVVVGRAVVDDACP